MPEADDQMLTAYKKEIGDAMDVVAAQMGDAVSGEVRQCVNIIDDTINKLHSLMDLESQMQNIVDLCAEAKDIPVFHGIVIPVLEGMLVLLQWSVFRREFEAWPENLPKSRLYYMLRLKASSLFQTREFADKPEEWESSFDDFERAKEALMAACPKDGEECAYLARLWEPFQEIDKVLHGPGDRESRT